MLAYRGYCISLLFFLCANEKVLGDPRGGMLYPQRSETRDFIDLSGLWNFKVDPDNVGMKEQWWLQPLPAPTILMAVPASYNDLTQDASIRDHIGWVWYELNFWAPTTYSGKRIMLRFESAHYFTSVWANGVKVVDHTGGHLPFEGEVTDILQSNTYIRLTVAVNNTLSINTLPPGEVQIYDGADHYHPKGYTVQNIEFDFFNYAEYTDKYFSMQLPKVHTLMI